ncbi:MAG: DNA-binding protein [Planctomycetota bacterium]
MSYLSLEEAAAKLGISTDRLVELRSEGQVRGFRDGASWKFPDTEIDRLADELGGDNFGSGILVNEPEMGDGASIGSIIGGDATEEGDGSDLNIGSEKLKEGSTGSDVNLVTGTKDDGSDVALVASLDSSEELLDGSDAALDSVDSDFDGDGLAEIDSAELQLNDPALMDDMEDSVDVAIDPKEGSTGPVAKAEIEQAKREVDGITMSSGDVSAKIGSEDDDFAYAGSLQEEDSDDLMLGDESEDSLDIGDLSEDELKVENTSASSLELMSELDAPSTDAPVKSQSGDVLSELDLLGNEKADAGSGSGLISGDSENLLTSSGLGSGLGSSVLNAAGDDALDASDDLVIADDDAELMLDSVSDISVAGDSGINLMSPSDSGLSLESEPLDLAGSSLSALDLGAELTDGSGISGGSSGSADGSAVDFQSADEEFQLSPSGLGMDADIESSSQVIEVEDSEVVSAGAVDFQDEFAEGGFADAGFAEAQPLASDAFGDAGDAGLEAEMASDLVAEDEVSPAVGVPGATGYEIPFSIWQCASLLFIVLVMSLGGMLMTDLVRNMWAYNEVSAPVSGLTDSLISMMGLDG